jgi:hypothetical protein
MFCIARAIFKPFIVSRPHELLHYSARITFVAGIDRLPPQCVRVPACLQYLHYYSLYSLASLPLHA